MSIYLNTDRHYRKLESFHQDEQKLQVVVEETDLLITIPSFIDHTAFVQICINYIYTLRQEIKNYVNLNPDFIHSLYPIKVEKNNHSLILAMAKASQFANVGPFAAIAGSIAQLTTMMIVMWIKQNYPKINNSQINVIVENGGDIYLFSQKERFVGILANPNQGQQISIKIKKNDFPTSLCSSSAKIGHSLSLGNGDIAMVKAKNAALADALATAYCNMLKTSKDINKVIELAKNHSKILIKKNPYKLEEIKKFLKLEHNILKFDLFTPFTDNSKSGLEGVFLQCDEHIGIWGDFELVS